METCKFVTVFEFFFSKFSFVEECYGVMSCLCQTRRKPTNEEVRQNRKGYGGGRVDRCCCMLLAEKQNHSIHNLFILMAL